VKAYATRFGYMIAMNVQAEADLPAAEGPGVGVDKTAAVKQT
jgi:hypothetical protein